MGGAGDEPAAWIAAKALAILPLAALALARRTSAGPWLGAALLAHGCGDLLIELVPWPAALPAFGAGHVLYAVAFRGERLRWPQVGGAVKLRLGLLALAAGVLLPRLLAGAPVPLAAPVVGYALALLGMAVLAQVAGRGQPWVSAGALAYVASDALLGFHLLAGPLDAVRALVWPLYWSGQAAIVLGWLGAAERRPLSRRG